MLKRFGLHHLFGKATAEAPSSPEATLPPLHQARINPPAGTLILIVDDSKTIQTFIARALARQGYETLAAFDGESGVELARQHHPALILMDVVLPGISGFQATRAIRRDEQISAIPVIIMSGNKEATDQFWSIKIGANDFLTKPFSDDVMFGCIENCLFTPQLHPPQTP